MPIRCATPKNSKTLRETFATLTRVFTSARKNMKDIESAQEGLNIWSGIGKPVFEAVEQGAIWRGTKQNQLEKIAGKMTPSETENILSAIIGGGDFYKLTGQQRQVAQQLERFMIGTLKEAGGLTDDQARNFLKRDLVRLRQANGDPNRFSPNEIYPESFQPFMDEILRGGINPNHNNAYSLAWDIINMGERSRFISPRIKEAEAVMRGWRQNLKGQVKGDDIEFTEGMAKDFLNAAMDQRGRTSEVYAQLLANGLNRLRRIVGKTDDLVIDDKVIARWASNMSSWYAGMAMSFRPALAIRNMTQVLLPGSVVGYGRMTRALKDVYGPNRKEHIERAFKELGIPTEGQAPIFFGESEGLAISNIGRGIKKLQALGLKPFRWADASHNRTVTYRMGELAILDEAPALINGKISWEQFMSRTGLKGAPLVDQRRIRSLLMGTEQPNVAQAAREFGKELVRDTQFIYSSANGPKAFKGTLGRLAGQFGTWPLSFGEFMYQNGVGARDAAYQARFMARFFAQKAALTGLGIGMGVDTSSWNWANPLTFQGGPWFQTIRDVSILGTSTNEFERRKARGTVARMFSQVGTPFAGVANPFGLATADIMQAVAEQDPLKATLLGLGFNVQD